MEILWFRLSLYFTLLAWLAVCVGGFAVYYNGLPGGANIFVSAFPLAIVSSVSTFIQWRCCNHAD
jgi:hypothetical protein